MHSRPILVLLVVMSIVIILLPSMSSAQDEPSPTLAPSKTPTQSPPLTPTATIQTIAAGPTRLTQPFTQADLSVITGNTQRPNGIAWHNDKLYTICSGDWTVYEIDATTGETAQYIYGVQNAHTLYPVTESDGLHLWIPDFQTNSLIHISQGVTNTVATDLKGPWGIASLDEDGFAITNLHGNNLVAISREGEPRELITNLRSPTGVAVDDNFIFIANTGSARRAIEWFDRQEVLSSETPFSAEAAGHPFVTGLQNTTDVILGPDGRLYFAYSLGTRGVVGRVDPNICIENGGCSHDQIEIVIYTELNAPLAGLSLSPSMQLYMHTIFNPDIYWLQLDEAE